METGEPHISDIPVESVMVSDVLVNLSPVADEDGPFSLDADMKNEIMKEYKTTDDKLHSKKSNDGDSKAETMVEDEFFTEASTSTAYPNSTS